MVSDAKGKEEISVEGYKESNIKKARLQSTLATLVNDPILSDVPKKPTLSDVDTLISLELGSAMRMSVLKLDGTSFGMAAMNSATEKDLKLAIRKKINEREQSKMGHRHISWKHIWRNFCLSYHNEKLLDDNAPVQHFCIHNHYQVPKFKKVGSSCLPVSPRVAYLVFSISFVYLITTIHVLGCILLLILR